MKTRQRLVVIGNGMAGGRFVAELLARHGQERFEIIVFGEEPHGSYNRTLLSGVLSGSHEPEDIVTNPIEWYRENGISLHAGVPVTAIDRARKLVIAGGGIEEAYDRLVLATGSRPFVPSIPGLYSREGVFLGGVFVFRTLDDAFRIIGYASNARKPVVLGGGLLGLEAARGLLNAGREVHVVEFMPHLMSAQLDPAAGRVLQSTLERIGLRFHLGKSITTVLGQDRIEAVTLSDGSVESCDMLVISAGVRPNIEFARQAGLAVDRGIVVGDDLACVGDPAIHAIGECAQHRGHTYGFAAPGAEQAKVLADRLSGANPQSSYAGSSTSTSLKVMGVDLVVLGRKEPVGVNDEVFTYTGDSRGIYQKVIMCEGRVAGAILLGDSSAAPRLLRAFHKNEKVPGHPALLFSPALPAGPAPAAEPSAVVASLEEVHDDVSDQRLKEVIAVIRPVRWMQMKAKSESLGIFACTHHRVVGRGRQRGLHFLARRGAAPGTGFRFLPKRMISWIVPESQVNALVQAIMEVNRTGQIGDGKIFVLPLDGVTQIPAAETHIGASQATARLLAHA